MGNGPGNEADEWRAHYERRLAAIVHADVVGYSRLIGLDDKGTVHRLRVLRNELIDPEIRRHGARIVNTAGDSMMIEFPSITAAVRCAIDFQRRVPEYDGDAPSDQLIRFRVGINIADIIEDPTDVHGNGVNIAARLQTVCPTGGICVTRPVYDHVRGRLSLPFEPLGELALKNIARPVEAFVLRLYNAPASPAAPSGSRFQRQRLPAWLAIAALLLLVLGGGWWWYHKQESESVTTPAPEFASSKTADEPLSIAVLPLDNLSGDPEQAYLADGIAEDLTTDLSHLAGALVIARESAFTYKGRAVDVREAGRQLGARYVVEGSVRKLGDVVRVNAQLVSTDTGVHLWAERVDEPIRDLGAGQEAIVERIGSALNVNLVNMEELRRTKAHAGNPAAFDLVMRARSTLNQPPTLAHYTIAAGLYEQALELDPESVPAMAGVASMLLHLFGDREFVNRAAELVAKAEQQAPGSPDVLVAKFLLQRRQQHWADSTETFRTLLEVDSSAAGIAAQTRICSICWGPPETAIPLLEKVVRLNPRTPNIAVLEVNLGRLLLEIGRDNDAIRWLEQSLQMDTQPLPEMPGLDLPLVDPHRTARFLLVSAYALNDRLDSAHRLLSDMIKSKHEMDMTVRSWMRGIPRYADPTHILQERRIAEGLRRAGLRDHLDEEADSGIPSTGDLREYTRADEPTPMSIPGAKTIRTEEMQLLLAGSKPLVLTTADPRFNPTIPGAVHIDMPGGGTMDDEIQANLRRMMQALLGEDRERPIVAFGYSINHWQARNAVLRLVTLGYPNVYWYRGGWEAWDAHDLPKSPLILEAR